MAKRAAQDGRAAELAAREAAVAETPVRSAPISPRGENAVALSARGEKQAALSPRGEKPALNQALRAYIEQQSGRPRFETADPRSRREQARQALNTATAGQILLGYWLAEIRAEEGQEAFQQAYAELNLGKSPAYRAIEHFSIFNQFDDIEVVQALGTLDPSAFRALRLSREEWCNFAKGGAVHELTLDQARELSFTELQKHERDWRLQDERIQALEKRNTDLANDLEVVQDKLNNATRVDPAGKLTKRDLWRRRKKLSAHGLAELAQRVAIEAGRLLKELTDPDSLPTSADDKLADKALCTAVQLEMAAARAAWEEVLGAFQVGLKGRVSTSAGDVPVMTRVEINDARTLRATMAEFTQKELDHLTALNYARDALDGETERGATPKAFRKLRKA